MLEVQRMLQDLVSGHEGLIIDPEGALNQLRAARRKRVALAATAGSLVLAVSMLAAFVAVHSSRQPSSTLAPASDKLVAEGRAETRDGVTRFCYPDAVQRAAFGAHRCEHSILLRGAIAGASEGSNIRIEGRFEPDGYFAVESWRTGERKLPTMPKTEVPCPEPAGGWASKIDPQLAALDRVKRENPGGVVASQLAGQDGHEVLVVASGSQAATDAIQRAYPSQVCVVASHYSAAQLEDAQRRALALSNDGNLLTSALGAGGDGQARLDVMVVRDSYDVQSFLMASPDGLVHVQYWFSTS